MYRVIIAGGRDFNDYPLLEQTVDQFLKNVHDKVTIFCGEASGADSLGERYALARGYAIQYFPPDWRRYGRAAGPVRNQKMAENADALVAFWDGMSRGTGNMIEAARRRQLAIQIQRYDGQKESGDRE